MTRKIKLKAITEYELKRFIKALPSNLLILTIITPLFLKGLVSIALFYFENKLQNLIYLYYYRLSSSYYYGFYDVLGVISSFFSFVPEPLRSYFVFAFIFSGEIVQLSSAIHYSVPLLITCLSTFLMIRTSRVMVTDDFYLLVRLDRRMLLVFRSVISALLCSLLVVLVVYVTKMAVVNFCFSWLVPPHLAPIIWLFSPIINWLTPSASLILPIFLFLLFIQSIVATINLYFSRITYIVPLINLFTFFILIPALYTVTQFYPGVASFASLLFSPNLSIQSLSPMLASIFNAKSAFSLLLYFPLSYLSLLIHIVTVAMGGIWNPLIFEPSTILGETVICFSSFFSFIFVGPSYILEAVPSLHQMLFSVLIVGLAEKLVYNPLMVASFFALPTVILLCLAAVIFGRKTI